MPESRKPELDEIDLALSKLDPQPDKSGGSIPHTATPDDPTPALRLHAESSAPVPVPPDADVTVPVHADRKLVDHLVSGLPAPTDPTGSGEYGIVGEIPPSVRAHLHSILASRHPDLTPEKMKQDYEILLRTMEECVLINSNSEPVPYFSDVIRSFSTEAMIFASGFQSPQILLVPDIRPSRLVRYIQDIITKIRSKSCINRIMLHPGLNESANIGPDTITKWTPTIVEGASVMPGDKLFTLSPNEPVTAVLERRSESRPAIDAGMDLRKYLMLVMAQLSQGIDTSSATIIDNEPLAHKHQVIQAFQTNKSQWIGLARNDKAVQNATSGFQIPESSSFRPSVDGEFNK